MAKTLVALFSIAGWIAGVATAQTGSVAQFGAMPDDITDSTQGIQAAIDAARGGRVYLPKDTAGTGAEIVASVQGGALSALKILTPGSHYCKAPEIALIGGGGEGARAIAHIDAECRLASVTIESAGSGYTAPPVVRLIPRARCYRVSQIVLTTGTVLEGDGLDSCIVPDGGNKPVIYSDGAYQFYLRNFSLNGDGKTDVGMRFQGATTARQPDGSRGSDALLCTLEAVDVTGFRTKNIELDHTWGFLFLNVHATGSAGWGLYLHDGFNNATQIIGGDYSSNRLGGVFIGTDSIQLYFSSVAENNGQYGVYYHGYLAGLEINDAYFEGNGRDGSGADVFGDFLDYDKPAIGVSVRNSLFNSQRVAHAASFQNTVDLEFSHNIGIPPPIGDPFLSNSVLLGKGVVNPRVDGNTGLTVIATSGAPVHTVEANFAENLLPRSGAMSAAIWKYANTGPGCAGRLQVCRDGVRFHDNGPAWKVPLATGSGAANMTTVSQTPSADTAGHLLGAGVWMRTDSGTATAWTEIAGYTGSVLNQPLRQTIDTNWRWVHINVATDSGFSPAVTFRMYANDGSPARAVYLFGAQAWLDVAGVPQYAATNAQPVRRRLFTPAISQTVSGPPNCRNAPDGIAGYDAAADKIWVCSNGSAKAH